MDWSKSAGSRLKPNALKMRSGSLCNIRRTSSMRVQRSTSQGNIQENHVDSDDNSTNSVNSPRKTRASTLRRRFTLNCDHNPRISAEEAQSYLTPTQRYEREIRQLKISLRRVSKQLEDKENEIDRLNEILIGQGMSSPARTNEITVICEEVDANELDITASEKRGEMCDSGVVTDEIGDSFAFIESLTVEHDREINKLKSKYLDELHECKESHNNKVEMLLARISEVNARHCDLREAHDAVLDKCRELEKEISTLKQASNEKEKHHHQMYVKMYRKGQEAAKFEQADNVMQFADEAPDRVSVPDLLQQLRITEHELERIKKLYQREVYNNRCDVEKKGNDSKEQDAENNVKETLLKNIESEITLNFLRDVVFHYFTDKDHSCSEGHLKALISILGYNEIQRRSIEKGIKKKRRMVLFKK